MKMILPYIIESAKCLCVLLDPLNGIIMQELSVARDIPSSTGH